MKARAQFDYTLADLIGISVGRITSSQVTFPSIEEVYPTLFEAEAKQKAEEEKRLNDSTNRFLEFALKHNAKMNAQKEV